MFCLIVVVGYFLCLFLAILSLLYLDVLLVTLTLCSTSEKPPHFP